MRLVDDIEALELDSSYFGDELEPQWFVDEVFTAKLSALHAYCERLGWMDVAESLAKVLPVQKNAAEALAIAQNFVVPEIRHLHEIAQANVAVGADDMFWEFLHPRIRALSRPRFEKGFYGDAVESAFKELNDVVKRIVLEEAGKEADGSGLMTQAFSPNDPIIRLNSLTTQSEKAEQQGYMMMAAGAMTGIRNPKAHANLNPTPNRAQHLIALASLLMYRVDERI